MKTTMVASPHGSMDHSMISLMPGSPFLPAIADPRKVVPKHVVSGTTIDEVYDKNVNEIKKVMEQRDELKTELA